MSFPAAIVSVGYTAGVLAFSGNSTIIRLMQSISPALLTLMRLAFYPAIAVAFALPWLMVFGLPASVLFWATGYALVGLPGTMATAALGRAPARELRLS